MINYKIQNVDIESVTLLSDVAIHAYTDHYLHLWKNNNADWYINKCFTIEVLTAELNDPNNVFYIVFENQKPLGFFKIVLNNPLLPHSVRSDKDGISEENALYLERVYFKKEAVGKGLGEIAFNFALDTARRLNKKIIWLTAMDSSLKPIAAYKRMGFEICGTKELDFECIKDELRGMVIMKKTL